MVDAYGGNRKKNDEAQDGNGKNLAHGTMITQKTPETGKNLIPG